MNSLVNVMCNKSFDGGLSLTRMHVVFGAHQEEFILVLLPLLVSHCRHFPRNTVFNYVTICLPLRNGTFLCILSSPLV